MSIEKNLKLELVTKQESTKEIPKRTESRSPRVQTSIYLIRQNRRYLINRSRSMEKNTLSSIQFTLSQGGDFDS